MHRKSLNVFCEVRKNHQRNVIQIFTFHLAYLITSFSTNNFTFTPKRMSFVLFIWWLSRKQPTSACTCFRSSTWNNCNKTFQKPKKPKNHSQLLTLPQTNSTKKYRNSSRSLTSLATVNWIVEKMGETFEAAFWGNTKRDYHFLNFGETLEVRFFQINGLINETQPSSIWFVFLYIPIRKPTQKLDPDFLGKEFFPERVASICISNSPIRNTKMSFTV